MSRNSHDVSQIFERSPVPNNNLADEKIRDTYEKQVPDLSVTADTLIENRSALFPIVEKNTIYTGPQQQEIWLPPTTSNKCILPSVTSKKQFDFEIPCHCLKNQVLQKAHYSSSRCDSTQQYQYYFDAESLQNGIKSPKQVADNISLTNMGTNLLEKRDYSTFSDDILRHFRQQDKKLDDLQSQISLFLQHKNSSDHPQNFLEFNRKEIDSDNKSLNSESYSKNNFAQNSNKIDELDQHFILMYIKEHSDQISKLQEQIDLLMKRTEKLESLYSINEKSVCHNEGMLRSSNGNCQFSANDEASPIPVDKSCETSQKEMVCHREKQVKKTSSSTMTSLTFEGSDKLVFRKMLTVVTDVSNCQKDVSIQCPQVIDTTASETRPKAVRTHSTSPQNERQITPKLTDSKKKKRKSQNSPKKSVNRNGKGNQEKVYQTTPETIGPTNNYSSAVLPEFRTINPDCVNQSSDSDRENKLVNDILSPKEKILFENISRNIDKLIGTQDEDCNTPSKNSNDHPKSVLKQQKGCKSNHTHRPVLSSSEKNKICSKSSSRSSSASSNNSGDFVYTSPKEGDKTDFHTTFSTRDFSAVSKYGMSSPNLSIATKMYLENYGLVHQSDHSSPEDKTKKLYSRKHRTLECRKQLR